MTDRVIVIAIIMLLDGLVRIMQPFTMFFPESFPEACELLIEHDAHPYAGGTALAILMKQGLFSPELLVNLRSLRAHNDHIEHRNGAIHIGGLATLREIEQDPLIHELCPVLTECLGELASIRIRNAATIGGNIAHADPSLDLPPVLAGLDADIVIQSPTGERSLPIAEFVTGYFETDLGDGELIKEIVIPFTEGKLGTYVKYRSLSEADWPCVGVAAFLPREDPPIPEVYLTAVADSPVFEVTGLDEVFSSEPPDHAITTAGDLARDQCTPVGDSRGSAWYKRKMAKVMTERALSTVFDQAVT